MILIDLLTAADKGYTKDFPESSLLEFVDEHGGPLSPAPTGDTLALFVVRELADTYDPQADDETQTATAVRAIEAARTNLDNINDALTNRLNCSSVPWR